MTDRVADLDLDEDLGHEEVPDQGLENAQDLVEDLPDDQGQEKDLDQEKGQGPENVQGLGHVGKGLGQERGQGQSTDQDQNQRAEHQRKRDQRRDQTISLQGGR